MPGESVVAGSVTSTASAAAGGASQSSVCRGSSVAQVMPASHLWREGASVHDIGSLMARRGSPGGTAHRVHEGREPGSAVEHETRRLSGLSMSSALMSPSLPAPQ